MKIYKTQEEVQADIKDGVLVIDDDVTFECSISIGASINAGHIKAWDINAENIDAENINAWHINAWDINAENIDAENINARDINAWNIKAWDIKYYAFCSAYNNINCKSIKADRGNASKPICLDGKLTLKTSKK